MFRFDSSKMYFLVRSSSFKKYIQNPVPSNTGETVTAEKFQVHLTCKFWARRQGSLFFSPDNALDCFCLCYGCYHTVLFLIFVHTDAISHAFTFVLEADLKQLQPMLFGIMIQLVWYNKILCACLTTAMSCGVWLVATLRQQRLA